MTINITVQRPVMPPLEEHPITLSRKNIPTKNKKGNGK